MCHQPQQTPVSTDHRSYSAAAPRAAEEFCPDVTPWLVRLSEQQPAAWQTAAVDAQQRRVSGVVLCREQSRNGHRYTPQALQEAVPLYLGKPVFLDHGSGSVSSRSTRDLVGTIDHPRYEQGALRGDIRVIDSEAGRTFLALVEANPPGVGMSHVVLARRGHDPQVIEAIQEVLSVDAVLSPAATERFREQADLSADTPSQAIPVGTGPLGAADSQAGPCCWDQQALHQESLRAAGIPDFLITPACCRLLAMLTPQQRDEFLAERRQLATCCRPLTPWSQPRRTSPTSDTDPLLKLFKPESWHVLQG
ncbi:MAG: hypothetical protein KatS3mg114_1456 [Planctomycetaceae bacterium]|nr:MAG: hypothetical protein KatS3mg114_1456 [Planctomycetaceae bacterium]